MLCPVMAEEVKLTAGWEGNLVCSTFDAYDAKLNVVEPVTVQRVALVGVRPGLMVSTMREEYHRGCKIHASLTRNGKLDSTDIAMPLYIAEQKELADAMSRVGFRRFTSPAPWNPPPGITPL